AEQAGALHCRFRERFSVERKPPAESKFSVFEQLTLPAVTLALKFKLAVTSPAGLDECPLSFARYRQPKRWRRHVPLVEVVVSHARTLRRQCQAQSIPRKCNEESAVYHDATPLTVGSPHEHRGGP